MDHAGRGGRRDPNRRGCDALQDLWGDLDMRIRHDESAPPAAPARKLKGRRHKWTPAYDVQRDGADRGKVWLSYFICGNFHACCGQPCGTRTDVIRAYGERKPRPVPHPCRCLECVAADK